MLSTPFTKLTGCRVPLQLAGMPVVTLELATAVAEAGPPDAIDIASTYPFPRGYAGEGDQPSEPQSA